MGRIGFDHGAAGTLMLTSGGFRVFLYRLGRQIDVPGAKRPDEALAVAWSIVKRENEEKARLEAVRVQKGSKQLRRIR